MSSAFVTVAAWNCSDLKEQSYIDHKQYKMKTLFHILKNVWHFPKKFLSFRIHLEISSRNLEISSRNLET